MHRLALKTLKCALIIGIYLMFNGAAFAQSTGLISPNDTTLKSLSPFYLNKIETFLGTAAQKLPTNLLAELNGRVQISFSNFSATPLKIPLCGFTANNSNIRDVFEVMPNAFVDAKRFEAGTTAEDKSKYIIKLNSHFLDVIFAGEEKAVKYNCGHRNLYKYAQAVFIREMARLYDDFNVFPKNNMRERNLLMQCAALVAPISTQATDVRCQEIFQWKYSVSDRPVWINLRNLQGKSAQIMGDDFSRHMEFFTLDPEFACRKPAIFTFLNRYFAANKSVECKLNTTIPVNLATDQFDLDIKRLYQIHVLVADPGEKIESRWGHIMFRLVMCDPSRATMGPECLQDIDRHLVVGFLGEPGTILTSNWDGFRGKYPSILSIQPYATALNEYTIKESRTLTSVPLKLSDDEKQLFVFRALEDYWAYKGKYLFLTNNCATEARSFLKGILQRRNYNLTHRQGILETPSMFLDFLIEQGYADGNVLNGKGSRDSYVISSPRQKWTDNAGALIDEIGNFSAEQRRNIFEQRKTADLEKNRDLAIKFYQVEMEIFAHLKATKDRILQSFVEMDQKNLNGDYLPLVIQLQEKVSALAPKNLVILGYGVPLTTEFKSAAQIELLQSQINEITRGLEVLLKRDRPEIFQALRDSNNNMKYFYIDVQKVNETKK